MAAKKKARRKIRRRKTVAKARVRRVKRVVRRAKRKSAARTAGRKTAVRRAVRRKTVKRKVARRVVARKVARRVRRAGRKGPPRARRVARKVARRVRRAGRKAPRARASGRRDRRGSCRLTSGEGRRGPGRDRGPADGRRYGQAGRQHGVDAQSAVGQQTSNVMDQARDFVKKVGDSVGNVVEGVMPGDANK